MVLISQLRQETFLPMVSLRSKLRFCLTSCYRAAMVDDGLLRPALLHISARLDL